MCLYGVMCDCVGSSWLVSVCMCVLYVFVRVWMRPYVFACVCRCVLHAFGVVFECVRACLCLDLFV